MEGYDRKRCTDGEAQEFFELTPAGLEDVIRDARAFLTEDVPRQKEADRLATTSS